MAKRLLWLGSSRRDIGRFPKAARRIAGFQLLRVQPQLGRLFAETDDSYGAARTVIVSHGFWQGRLGADAPEVPLGATGPARHAVSRLLSSPAAQRG